MVSVSLKKATYCTAVPPSVDLLMTGSVTPAGNWYLTCCTLARISVMARSASALSTRRALISLLPWVVVELRYSMPLAVAMDCEIGVVTKPCITSCVAPGKDVVTVTVAFSRYGYCRTGSENTAAAPISRISRLTTSARMGRRMKMSVKLMTTSSLPRPARDWPWHRRP